MHKKDSSKTHKTPSSRENLEDHLAHSLVELQKVHVNLAEKFDKLSQQIENLLALFELAARNFAKQPHMQGTEKDKEFLDKIDKLLEQNKVLAKGLTLMEEKMRERLYGPGIRPPQMRGPPPTQQPMNRNNIEEI
ncbi:MAG: hypothetical protein AABY16_03205 [Nanoarchaeota archaeon]